MNNAMTMSANFEARKNSQASMITAGVAGALLLLMFLWKWTVPVFEAPPAEQGILVEMNLPPEEEFVPARGGGGGGNPVQASGPAGTAPETPPQPGTPDDAKDIEEDETEKTTPAILKPDNPKPTATKINENKSEIKAEPKPIVTTPAPPPPKPKAVLGRTTTGSGQGGGAAQDYDKSGGSGTGSGVGNGTGSGGGRGTGTGGGNGSGTGRGSGPRVSRGDRSITTSYAFTGNLPKATIFADIKVSPDGIGQFLQFAKGSTSTSSAYKTEIMQYLRNIKFNRSDHESLVTVQFNFTVTN
jgi:hypothetical protein